MLYTEQARMNREKDPDFRLEHAIANEYAAHPLSAGPNTDLNSFSRQSKSSYAQFSDRTTPSGAKHVTDMQGISCQVVR